MNNENGLKFAKNDQIVGLPSLMCRDHANPGSTFYYAYVTEY